MLELFSGGIFGSLLGGIFRLAPEVLKWLDKKSERAHELEMFKAQCELEKQKGDQKLAEIGAQREAAVDTGVLQAFNSAIDQQAEMVKAAGGWVASLSASVRPMVTYWILAIWSFVHLWYAFAGVTETSSPSYVFNMIMSQDFAALVGGTINYWFIDRTLRSRGL